MYLHNKWFAIFIIFILVELEFLQIFTIIRSVQFMSVRTHIFRILNNNNNNNKVLHGQYIRNIDRQLISEEDVFLWLSKGDLKAETESEIVAAQDQALQTKYYATKY